MCIKSSSGRRESSFRKRVDNRSCILLSLKERERVRFLKSYGVEKILSGRER
jgi:hypothetical protein